MKKQFILLLCLGVVGCSPWFGIVSGPGVSETPYVKEGKFGYSDYKISKDTFLVRFRGNNKTTLESAQKKAFTRADEITIKNRYTHYIILEKTAGQKRIKESYPFAFYSEKSLPEVTLKIKCFRDKYSKDAILAKDWRTPVQIQQLSGSTLMIQDHLGRWYYIYTREEFDKLNFDSVFFKDREHKSYNMSKKEIFEKIYSTSEINK